LSTTGEKLTLIDFIRKQAGAIRIGLSLLLGNPGKIRHNVALVARFLWNVKVRRKGLVVLVRRSGLGDLVSILGCVRGLRDRHPNSWTVVISPPGCSELAASSGLSDAVADRGSFFHGVIKWLGARGFFYHPLLPDEYDPPRPQRLHLADEFARALGVSTDVSGIAFRARGRARRFVEVRLRELNAQQRPIVVLHPGPTWPVREWPRQQWCELAKRISETTSAIMIKIGTDVDSLGQVRPLGPIPNAVDWTNHLDISETAALLELTSVFVGIDSGPLHIAGVLGVPVVGLFGPVSGHLRLHPRARATLVSGSVDCLGCHHTPTGPLHWKTGCPHDINCMREITVKDVFNAVTSYLDGKDYMIKPQDGAETSEKFGRLSRLTQVMV
jgi:ADP-heptose:LPS heptosyltransferase